MIFRKAALVAGALVFAGSAAWAQGVDLGARAVVTDTFNNERALQEQAEYRAERNAFETGRAGDARAPGTELRPEMTGPRTMATAQRVGQREATTIAREQGLERVQRVSQSGGVWNVTGIDAEGERTLVRVGRDGEVIDMRRI